MRLRLLSLVPLTLAFATVSAFAIPIPNGTVSSAHLFAPSVNLAVNPSTYSSVSGTTFQVTGTGGFAGAMGGTGTMNGTISFSDFTGTSIAETLTNLFVFSDGSGGTFNFSASSVTTNSFSNNPGVASSFTLYLLGTTLDMNLGETATPTSLTITANSTGGSPFSSSATLAVPPVPTTVSPEPSSLALLGTGMLGVAGAFRRRFKK